MSHPFTRRNVLQAFLAAGVTRLPLALAAQGTPRPQWILLGDSQGKGIYRAAWDARSGTLGTVDLAVATPSPSYIALHPRQPVLYACNEIDSSSASISAFTLDRRSASLHPLATQPTGGGAPCFVSVDRTGRLLFAANYGGGSLAVFPLDAQGRPGPAATVFDCAGSTLCGSGGPVKDRQSSPHLHCATLSPEGCFVLACDLGDDAILAFPIHPGEPHPLGPLTRIQTSPGAGPRHLAFHPNGRWLYCINELSCTVSLYRWLPKAGQPAAEAVPGATVNLRPANAPKTPPSTAAEIVISHDGRFLYTSTRFSDVLTIFSIDPTQGRLTEIQQIPCGGKTPRFFAFDPSQRWLLCASQDSNSITTFARDSNTGRLAPKQTCTAPNPMCILWL